MRSRRRRCRQPRRGLRRSRPLTLTLDAQPPVLWDGTAGSEAGCRAAWRWPSAGVTGVATPSLEAEWEPSLWKPCLCPTQAAQHRFPEDTATQGHSGHGHLSPEHQGCFQTGRGTVTTVTPSPALLCRRTWCHQTADLGPSPLLPDSAHQKDPHKPLGTGEVTGLPDG